jgi:cell division protein FtsQ
MPRVARSAGSKLSAGAIGASVGMARGTNVLRQPIPLPDRPSALKLFLRRWRKMARPTVQSATIALLVVAGIIAANLAWKGPSWRDRLGNATAGLGLVVADIVIDGRVKTPQSLVLQALGTKPGMPILQLSVAEARARLEALTWVREASVERHWPSTVSVTITERRPFALWQKDGKFQLIDRAGAMVTDSNLNDFADKVPLVVGDGADQAAVALIDLLGTQPDLLNRMVAAIRVAGRRWNLCMRNGADVLLPEGAEQPALVRLAEYQAKHQVLDRPMREIDLRLPDQLRLRPQGTDGTCMNAAEPNRAPSPAARKAP